MDLKSYKCINCGSNIEYEPNSSMFTCQSCASQFSKEDMDSFYDNVQDEDFQESQTAIQMTTEGQDYNTEENNLQAYNCNSCGGEIIVQGETVATFCPYCKSPTIIKAKLKGEFKPNYILPFKLDEKSAKEIYKKWISKKIYTPKDFKSKERIDEIKGIYAPYWLYDMNMSGGFVGTGRNVSSWRSGDYVYTKTDYYTVRRAGSNSYNKVPKDASSQMEDHMMNLIEPFNYDEMKEFAMPYMSGFLAERFDEDQNVCLEDAKGKAQNYFESRLTETVRGYSSFNIISSYYNFSDIHASYAMLPTYYLMNKYKNKKCEFMINGQTGNISGNPPFSWAIFFKYLIIAFIVCYLAVALVGVFNA